MRLYVYWIRYTTTQPLFDLCSVMDIGWSDISSSCRWWRSLNTCIEHDDDFAIRRSQLGVINTNILITWASEILFSCLFECKGTVYTWYIVLGVYPVTSNASHPIKDKLWQNNVLCGHGLKKGISYYLICCLVNCTLHARMAAALVVV
jgi:hypothetical protein